MIDKNTIPYDKIDTDLLDIIKKLNSLPYLATTQSCQGHPYEWKRYLDVKDTAPNPHNKYTGNLYIDFEVYDEDKFLELSKNIQRAVVEELNEYMYVTKGYDFTITTDYKIRWHWSLSISGKTEQDILEPLEKCRGIIRRELNG